MSADGSFDETLTGWPLALMGDGETPRESQTSSESSEVCGAVIAGARIDTMQCGGSGSGGRWITRRPVLVEQGVRVIFRGRRLVVGGDGVTKDRQGVQECRTRF